MHDAHQYYDRDQAESYDIAREQEAHWALENDFIAAAFADGAAGKIVLDAPVGTGRFLPCYRQATSIIGVDASPDMLAMAQRRVDAEGLRGVELKAADLLALPLADTSVDVTVCWRFLHLLPPASLAPTLRELTRVTRQRIILQAYIRGPWLRRSLSRLARLPSRLRRVMATSHSSTAPWSHIPAWFHDAHDLHAAVTASGWRVAQQTRLCHYQGHGVDVLILEP